MRIAKVPVYKIGDHPTPEKCYDWIRNHWHDLNSHSVDDIVNSIRALAKIIGGNYDYSISQFSDRGEFICFTGYDWDKAKELKARDLPLTGVFWDELLINCFLVDGNQDDLFEALHKDSEYVYSNSGLFELCEINEYEFTKDGVFWSSSIEQ